MWESVQSGSKKLAHELQCVFTDFFSYFMKKLGSSGSEE
jgi:hypothetical protein